MKIVCILSLMPIYPVHAAEIDVCKLTNPNEQYSALGFPISSARLKSGDNKILVVPYQLTDTPEFSLGPGQENDFVQASELITRLSNGKARISFVFHKTVNAEMSTVDLVEALRIQAEGSQQRNEGKSTWGLLRKLFTTADSKIDFSAADIVIFVGSSTSSNTQIAGSMSFNPFDATGFFRPLSGDGRKIFNAILLDQPKSSNLIAHEIMHTFGLVDLYGSNVSNSGLSLMDGITSNLLNYEKWLLGWHPDSQVQCIDDSVNTDSLAIREIALSKERDANLVVIKTSKNSAMMIETTIDSSSGTKLAFYFMKMDNRPPIRFYPLNNPGNSWATFPSLTDFRSTGSELVAPSYSLLIKEVSNQMATIVLIPSAVSNSDTAVGYRTAARNLLQAEIEKIDAAAKRAKELENEKLAALESARIEAEAKAEAESKARAEAEAKAKAEAESKAKAEAKAVLSNKKTITCIKGKSIKKLTAVNPKCPKGYQKK